MVNTSCSAAAEELLRQCIAGEPWNREFALRWAEPECVDGFFRILVEGLADRFEPRLCDAYASIFSFVSEERVPGFRGADLYARYQRVRLPHVCTIEPKRVAVLSRVTLGADVAITSVLLDGVRQRFPKAEICFAGGAKAAELFSGFHDMEWVDIPYARKGTIGERFEAWRKLAGMFGDDGTIVVDPDSRLCQLGMLPLNDESRYFFFESRAYGGDGEESLTRLAQRWVSETFGVEAARNRISPPLQPVPQEGRYASVSLGCGENPNKRMAPEMEAALMRLLCARFDRVIVDVGFGAEEAGRVERAIAGTHARAWSGSFAQFASVIRGSALYLGYDSAGQHAAASFGTPLVSLFKGYVNDRMFARWQPTGPGPKQVVKVTESTSWEQVEAAVLASSCLAPGCA